MVDAVDVNYDNTSSGLAATNVQTAIDEIVLNGVAPAAASITADQFPANYDAVNLPAIRKRLRAMADIFDFGVTPSSPDFHAAIMAAHNQGVRRLLFTADRTSYPVSSGLIFDRGITLQAEGRFQAIVADHTSATALWWRGQTSSGGGMIDFGISHPSPQRTITAISRSNPAVVSYTGTSLVGVTVVVIKGVAGMEQVNDRRFLISNVTASSFELTGIDSTGYGAYTSDGVIYPGKGTAILVGGGAENATSKADNTRFSNVNITAAQGVWDYGMIYNGLPYNGATLSLGIRNSVANDIILFNCAVKALDFRQARGYALVNCDINVGNGVDNSVLVNGSGSFAADGVTRMRSDDIKLANLRCGGIIYDWATSCVANGQFNGTFSCTANSNNIFGVGRASSFQNAGTNCRFARGDETSF